MPRPRFPRVNCYECGAVLFWDAPDGSAQSPGSWGHDGTACCVPCLLSHLDDDDFRLDDDGSVEEHEHECDYQEYRNWLTEAYQDGTGGEG